MYGLVAPSGRDADTQPAPAAWAVVSKVAILLGLVIVVCAARDSSQVALQAYTVPRVAGVATSSAMAAPVLGARTLRPIQLPLAAGPSTSSDVNAEEAVPKVTQPNVLRGFGWATLWLGTMAALGSALWTRMSAINQETLDEEAAGSNWDPRTSVAALSATAMALSFNPAPASAEIRLPPLDTDPNRCQRGFVGNTIGQANGVSDKPLDLRMCELQGKNFEGLTLSGALMVDGNFQGASFVEAILSKVYAPGANFKGADFTSAVLDRGTFDKADMSGAKFYNTVITGATFKGTDLTGAEFEDSLIGSEDAKRLCANPTLTGESRLGVGCRD